MTREYDWLDATPFRTDLLHDDLPLAKIKERHTETFRSGESVRCLCCDRTIKAYPRRITPQMAHALALLTRDSYTSADLIRLTKCRSGAGDHHKLAHWGLIRTVSPPDETPRLVITNKGWDFAHSRIRVPKYCLLYNDKAWGFSIDTVEIKDCNLDFDIDNLLAPETVQSNDWIGY